MMNKKTSLIAFIFVVAFSLASNVALLVSTSLFKLATTTFEAIKISSGNSFVHETESQVILNGSRDINFTMTLVLKDIEMFQELAKVNNIPLDISPKLIEIFKEGVSSFGADSNSPSIIKRLERKTGLNISAPGFPAKIVDDEPEKRGFEVKL